MGSGHTVDCADSAHDIFTMISFAFTARGDWKKTFCRYVHSLPFRCLRIHRVRRLCSRSHLDSMWGDFFLWRVDEGPPDCVEHGGQTRLKASAARVALYAKRSRATVPVHNAAAQSTVLARTRPMLRVRLSSSLKMPIKIPVPVRRGIPRRSSSTSNAGNCLLSSDKRHAHLAAAF